MAIALSCLLSLAAAAELTDDEIRALLIEQSFANYSGNCPCPYNFDRAGKLCGKRSAYSKSGGVTPRCFPQDVTEEMIEDFRKRHPTIASPRSI